MLTKLKKFYDIFVFVKFVLFYLSFVVFGYVDAGKLILMGRLFYDLNIVN